MSLTNEQLQQLLMSVQYGMNQFGGPSLYDQYRKATKPAEKTSAILGGGIAALQGATQLIGNADSMAQIGDTTSQEERISGISNIGNTDYNSFEQLSSDYDRLAAAPIMVDYDDIRGKSDGELAGGVLSSALSGASTGLAIGGPWGALAGGVVGLGSGLAGVFTGNRSAKDKKERLELEGSIASSQAQRNLSLANENLMDYNFRSGVSRRAELGGKIKHKQSIENFAARIMRKPRFSDTKSPSIKVMHGEGGTIVRIKQ